MVVRTSLPPLSQPPIPRQPALLAVTVAVTVVETAAVTVVVPVAKSASNHLHLNTIGKAGHLVGLSILISLNSRPLSTPPLMV